MEKVHISDHFTYGKIFRITLFPMVMMIFSSLYSIVDGIFIANFASESSFAAVNLIWPFLFIIGGIGFMFGTGGTALVSKLLGEKREEDANSAFSLIIYTTIVVGIIFSIGGYFLVEPIVKAMASISKTATDEMVKEAIKYGRLLALGQVLFMLQNVFQSFFMVAEKSRLGFIFIIAGGVSNMICDALFIGLFKWGVIGAAFATMMGYVIAGIGPLFYFIFKKDGIIHLGKAKVSFRIIGRASYNGMSEFIANISMSIVSIVYNALLLKAYGEPGVAAYGIVMYVGFVFMAIFIGYSLGIAPAVGYNYGAKNTDELTNILKKSGVLIVVTSVVMAIFGVLAARPFSHIFSKGDEGLVLLSTKAMRIYSTVFLFCGFSIFASCFFTALNNGTVSAIISISRTLLFQIGFAFLLPPLLGNNGIWWAIAFGEMLSTAQAIIFLLAFKKKYGY